MKIKDFKELLSETNLDLEDSDLPRRRRPSVSRGVSPAGATAAVAAGAAGAAYLLPKLKAKAAAMKKAAAQDIRRKKILAKGVKEYSKILNDPKKLQIYQRMKNDTDSWATSKAAADLMRDTAKYWKDQLGNLQKWAQEKGWVPFS